MIATNLIGRRVRIAPWGGPVVFCEIVATYLDRGELHLVYVNPDGGLVDVAAACTQIEVKP